MNLALTDDQIMIRDAAQAFLADASDSAAVRKAMESAQGFDEKVWRRIGGELGWCGTTIPEAFGGLGLGPQELVLILEQTGRHLLCAPFFSSIAFAANLVAQAGTAPAKKQYLPKLADGSLRGTAAFDGELKLAGARLSGSALMADAATADLLLFVVKGNLFAVPRTAPGVSVKPLRTWDATRRIARVELKKVAAEKLGGGAGVARALALARLYLAAEQLGGAQECLDLIVRYTTDRKQFGRAIASFQAVKHRCAQLMVMVESLRSAVYGAAALAAGKVGRPSGRLAAEIEMDCAMAKALASDTFFHAAQEAIQLHGGVGFTWEFAPHLYFKRAQATSHWLGSSESLREEIGVRLLFPEGKLQSDPYFRVA